VVNVCYNQAVQLMLEERPHTMQEYHGIHPARNGENKTMGSVLKGLEKGRKKAGYFPGNAFWEIQGRASKKKWSQR